jgi:exodeoxyribonuclease VII small subunit
MTKKIDKENKVSFEDAMSRLESIVSELEDEDLSLEKSLTSFEEGMKLAKVCETKLSEASGRVEKIMKDFSGAEKRVAHPAEEISDSEESESDEAESDDEL